MNANRRRKNLILTAGLAAGVLLFLLIGGVFFSKYLQAQIFEERTTQLVELTSQVQINLDNALDGVWHDLTTAVNFLNTRSFETAQDVIAGVGALDRLLETDSGSAALLLLDGQGNYYDAGGKHGVWSDIGVISQGGERYTFITDSYDRQNSYWTFVKKLEVPLRTEDGSTVFTHAVMLKDVKALAEYYDSGAYADRNETYILKSDGTRMHDNAPGDHTIQGYNVLKVLEEMEGQGIPDIRAALRETDTVSSKFDRGGREYYYCITSLAEYDTLLLFLIPAELVAVSAVNMMQTTIRTLLFLVTGLVAMLILAIAAVLRQRAGARLFRQEQENLRRQEALNRQLEESNAKLTQSQAAAEQAFAIAQNANRAKSSFLSSMSHDIRTPMNAVVGFAALLQKDAENPEKVREYTRKITASSQHLLGLINDILDISKIEAGKTALNLSEESIVDLIEGINSIIRPQMRAKGHTFEVYSEGIRHEDVVIDKLRLNQILLNLLSNAAKYTPDGGRVRLTVQELPQGAGRLAHYRFIVEDNGYGMSPEYVKNIFGAFTREEDSVTSKIQGSGLGMAITKNLIDLMGGSIAVESEKGRGSVFTVDLELPISERAADHDFWRRHDITRLLVADDEEAICRNIRLAMEGTGVAVDCVPDGQAALDRLKHAQQGGKPYDIALLDDGMPVLDGVETVRRVRRELSGDAPMLILTGYDWLEVEDAAEKAGVDAFLPKPFFLTSFRQKVGLVLDGAAPEPEAEEQYSALRGLHILAAEDNEINAEILRELLDMAGASCEVCENGALTVQAFARSAPGEYQLILMDVQMPEMNGYEATRAIRGLDHPMAQSIPIIAMTANAFTEDVRDALEAGMNAHVAKPVDMEALERAVRGLTEGSRPLAGGAPARS